MTLYLFNLSYEPSDLFFEYKDGLISPHLIGWLKKNALRIRRVSFICHVGVKNEGLK